MGRPQRSWRTGFFYSSAYPPLSRFRQSVFDREAGLSSSLGDLFSLLAQFGDAVNDIPPHHHEVVLVIHIVAVDQVSADEIPELHPQLDRILSRQRIDITARVPGVFVGIETDALHLLQIDWHSHIGLIYRIRSGRSLQDSPFFEVDMHRMDPGARNDIVPQMPLFG